MDPPREMTMDEETFARRRERRVSFAETTAVHVFDRDDSSGMSPKNESNATLSSYSDSGGDESSVDTREDGDDDNEDEEGLAVPPVRFIRDLTDSSPGSASAASVASNDDDNFFGPVSTSFMNSGRPSDSGISEDDNNVGHDITLDSTAFSLHFNNIGRDDRSANSACSLRTTPTTNNITPFVRGSINELSGANASVARFQSSHAMSSAGLGDFSLVANNSNKYNFMGLSDSLNDLLRQAAKPASPVTFETASPLVDVSENQNGEGAKLPIGEVSRAIDVSVDHNGEGAKLLTRGVSNPIDISLNQSGDSAKLLTCEVSRAIDGSRDQNGDGQLLTGEISYPIDVSMHQNGDGSTLLGGEVSCPIDASMDQNDDGEGEVSHPIDALIDKDGNDANLLAGEVSHPIDVLMEKNVNCDELPLLRTHASDAAANEKYEDNSEDMYEDARPNTIPYSPKVPATSPQHTISPQIESAIAVSSPCITVQHPESELPMVTPKVAFVDAQTSAHAKMAQLSETTQSQPIGSELFKRSEKISAIKEATLREFQKENATLSCLNFKNENLLPSQSPVENIVSKQEFDLEGRKRKLEQLLGGAEDHPANHAKPLAHECSPKQLVHRENPQICSFDRNKMVEDMSEIRRVLVPPSVQKLTKQENDGPTLLAGEVSCQIDVSIDENGDGSMLLTREVSHPIDVLTDKDGDGVKLLTGVSHSIDVLTDKDGDDAKLVTGEVSHPIDVSMEKNVNCDELPILGTPASDAAANEKDEDYPEDMHEDTLSNTVPYSPKVTAASSPQPTVSQQVESAIALSSPLTMVQHPESELPMATPKVAFVKAEPSSHAKMAQLSETPLSPSIGSELFKHSERISAIKESILREFQKENTTLSHLDFKNENLRPSQYPVQTVICNQEFDLEGRKRKLQQLLRGAEDHPAKHAKPLVHQSSPKQQKHGENPQNCSLDRNKVVEDMSEITKMLVSPSVEKLKMQELNMLHDMMEKLQMARKFERLSTVLRNHDSTDQQQKRLAKAISLHDKLLYEKAKLELNHLKLNKLRSKAELVRQQAQECLHFKARILDLGSSSSNEGYAEHNCFPTNSISVTQEEKDRLISKRQALKVIEQNIINLGASLCASCKITEDLSCDDIITVAKEHLKMKNIHSVVQRDAKLWKLHDIVKEDERHEIVLDYNFLFQRFTLGTGQSGSILVNTMLNKTKIIQAFRDMNAYSAIEFVFRTKCTDRNIDGSKHVRQEILETSLLLGNVVDVLHEVQAAKREHFSLISTNFNCKLSNPNMLQLQLSFMNFKRAQKVVLSLNLSDLKFAVYPSEPSELKVEIDRTMTTLDEVLLEEITALIQRLPAGRLMVLRFCRTVSQYVHSSSI